MCGRYTLASPNPAEVRARFNIAESVEVRQRYNVAPGDDVLAVTTDKAGAPRGELLRWGLVPTWAKDPNTGLKMINARVETAAERPAYRRAFERYRCLILADGFYEWQPVSGGPKQPFHITRADGSPFAFAGLWSIWHAPDGDTLRTCTILTTSANSAIRSLHDRMPIILAPDAERFWLDAGTPQAELGEILAGLPASQTALRAVGIAVNDARYDGPECLAASARTGADRPLLNRRHRNVPLPLLAAYDHVVVDLDGCVWVSDEPHATRTRCDRRAPRRATSRSRSSPTTPSTRPRSTSASSGRSGSRRRSRRSSPSARRFSTCSPSAGPAPASTSSARPRSSGT